jgi:hypothetical protein
VCQSHVPHQAPPSTSRLRATKPAPNRSRPGTNPLVRRKPRPDPAYPTAFSHAPVQGTTLSSSPHLCCLLGILCSAGRLRPSPHPTYLQPPTIAPHPLSSPRSTAPRPLHPRTNKSPCIPSPALSLSPDLNRPRVPGARVAGASCAHDGAQGGLQGRGGVPCARAPERPVRAGAGMGPRRLRVGAGGHGQGRGAAHVLRQQLRQPRDQVRME